jgi:3-methyladenine DNA glycosylase Tag
MKVIYKKSVKEKLLEEISNAKKNSLKIDHIIFTKQEYQELNDEYGNYSDFAVFGKIYGFNFTVED